MSAVWEALARTPQQARAAGVDFLLKRQSSNGLWSDFRLAPGLSDEWVSGYVGDRIAGIDGTQDSMESAWTALVSRRAERTGRGWGYNAHVPQDADSTAWALRLAALVGHAESPTAVDARESLAGFRRGNGLLATYDSADAIAHFIGADATDDFLGWTAGHACVTAAAAGVSRMVDADALLAAQQPDGRWHSYWWVSDAYATSLTVEALQSLPQAAAAISRAAAWAKPLLKLPGRTAFDTACLLLICTIAEQPDAAAARELTFTVLPDGSWPAGAMLRVPHPHDTTPEHFTEWIPDGRVEGSVVKDVRRVFTTATVTHALHLFAREEGDW